MLQALAGWCLQLVAQSEGTLGSIQPAAMPPSQTAFLGMIGMSAASAVGRNPGAATPILVQAILAIAFAEAIVFYALFLVR